MGDGILSFSAFLDCVLCVQPLLTQTRAAQGKWAAERAGEVGNRHLFVLEASAKCVQLCRAYVFLWGRIKKEKIKKENLESNN